MLARLPCQFAVANEKLHKLFHARSPLDCKCLVMQDGICPQAFYGAVATASGWPGCRSSVGTQPGPSPEGATHFGHGDFRCPSNGPRPKAYLMRLKLHQLRTAFRYIMYMPNVAAHVLQLATRNEEPAWVHGPGNAIRTMFRRNGCICRYVLFQPGLSV